MALNDDGFEGGAFLTLEQQAELRAKQHAAEQKEETGTAASVKRKRKASADKLAVTETAEETAKSE